MLISTNTLQGVVALLKAMNEWAMFAKFHFYHVSSIT